jgi:hypothetical protein
MASFPPHTARWSDRCTPPPRPMGATCSTARWSHRQGPRRAHDGATSVTPGGASTHRNRRRSSLTHPRLMDHRSRTPGRRPASR